MNLKFKLTKKITAVAQITDDNTAIFSDECSPTHRGALRIITAKSPKKLRKKIDALAISLAEPTRFACVICYVKDDTYEVKQLTQSSATSEYKVW